MSKSARLFCLLLLPFFTAAQNRTITGIVSAKGAPLKGVVVWMTYGDTTTRDTTDDKGRYSVVASADLYHLSFRAKEGEKPLVAKLYRKKARRLNFDTEQAIGYVAWKGNASLQGSVSFFSTYQTGGNNNNTSLLLGNINLNGAWYKGRYSWGNDVKLLYGQSMTAIPIQQPNGEMEIRKLTAKSSDLMSFTSKYGYELRHEIHVTLLSNFQSQFTPSYRDPYAEAKGKELTMVSDLLSPAKFNLGMGIDYKPSKWFSLYLSPINLDALMVINPALRQDYNVYNASGVAPRMGAFLNMDWNYTFFKKAVYSTKLQVLTNYLKNEIKPGVDRPGSVDIQLWRHNLSYQFNKYLALSFSALLRYDEDIQFQLLEGDQKNGAATGAKGPRAQYFHNLGINLGYSWAGNKKYSR